MGLSNDARLYVWFSRNIVRISGCHSRGSRPLRTVVRVVLARGRRGEFPDLELPRFRRGTRVLDAGQRVRTA